jgi:hypothetical protein
MTHLALDIVAVVGALVVIGGAVYFRIRTKAQQVIDEVLPTSQDFTPDEAAQVAANLGSYNKVMAEQRAEAAVPATEAETLAAHSLSGNCGAAAAVVFLAGDSIGATVADSKGNFTFADLPAGTYAVIPKKPGSIFHPKLRLVNIVDTSAAGIDFLDPVSFQDCRNYGNFPNNSTNINGTLTYTVQQFESRKAGAPVDSRTAGAPVACGTYPQNSRANLG